LVRYLKALGMKPYVMHDLDGVEGATKFNQPIATAVGNNSQIFILDKCIEDVLGYSPPNQEKPYAAYKYTKNWTSLDDVPKKWRNLFESIFNLEQYMVGGRELESPTSSMSTTRSNQLS